MHKVFIPEFDLWDEKEEKFIHVNDTNLQLEHSLVSISKWESKWEKPFLTTEMSFEQSIDYIKCMTLTQNVNPYVYYGLTKEIVEEIRDYIAKPMTATWFSDNKKSGNKEIITNEIIYYWMISLQIPIECQKWHLNRLLTLIRVCNEMNSPKKKMSKRELMERNRKINEARRKAMNADG